MPTTTAYGATTGETYGEPLTIRYVTVNGERRYYSTQPHDGGYWVSDVARTDNGTGKSWYQAGNSFWVRSLAAARQGAADKHDPAVTRIADGKRVRRVVSSADRHKQHPITLRLPEGDRAWLEERATATGRPVRAILAEALAAYRLHLDTSTASEARAARETAAGRVASPSLGIRTSQEDRA
jgi:hypothetical protein